MICTIILFPAIVVLVTSALNCVAGNIVYEELRNLLALSMFLVLRDAIICRLRMVYISDMDALFLSMITDHLNSLTRTPTFHPRAYMLTYETFSPFSQLAFFPFLSLPSVIAVSYGTISAIPISVIMKVTNS